MARRLKPVDSIPCDQSLVVMGNSYDGPPTEWSTRQETCQSCHVGFTISASEQQFWYEDLRIPYIVSINRCPECRKRQRSHRRIIAQLSRLLPLIDAGTASVPDQRETVLTIAEGMIIKIATVKELNIAVLSTTRIAEKCTSLIAVLRQTSKAHDDLVPILIMIHERSDHPKRVAQLNEELRHIRQRSVAMERAVHCMQTWLAWPIKTRRDRIIKPPRA